MDACLLDAGGKESAKKKHKDGCLFDHASGLTFVCLQSHLDAHETLKPKKAFAFCAENGVVVQTCLSDNGTAFWSAEFEEHPKAHHQHRQ